MVTAKLLSGCLDCLHRHGINTTAESSQLDVAWVPGSFELPLVAQQLARSGRYQVVITLGESGSIGAEVGKEPVVLPSLELQAVDTTGAGDVYHGAFAHALAGGHQLDYCMAFATAAAGLKCRVLGGRAGIPGPEETVVAAESLLERAHGDARDRRKG